MRPRRTRLASHRAVRSGRVALALAVALVGAAARAEPGLFTLDPAESSVHMRLGATLHTVRGEARVLAGAIEFDTETGEAGGSVVVDARSLTTGNDRRDRKMREEVLETDRYPEIVFTARRIDVTARTADAAEFVLHGDLRLHEGVHPVALDTRASRAGRGRYRASAVVVLPYVAWGLRDVSSFLFRVDPEVSVEIDVVGEVGGGNAVTTGSSRRAASGWSADEE